MYVYYRQKLLQYKLSNSFKYFHFIVLQRITPRAPSYYVADLSASGGQNVANKRPKELKGHPDS